jgi:CheY-specific phosphatase CheX
MAILDSQKVDLLYKKLFGVAKTDLPGNKGLANEATASPTLNRGDKVWTQAGDIPTTPAAVPGIVEAYQTTSRIECTADATSTLVSGVYPSWKTNLTDWITPEFGAEYFVKVYADTAGAANPASTGTQLSDAGISSVGEWFFDYQAGVLNFIGGSIPTYLVSNPTKKLFVVGYRYIGLKGTSYLANLNVTGNVNAGNVVVGTIFANALIIPGLDLGALVSSNITTNTAVAVNVISGNVTANSWFGLYTANVIETAGNLYYTNARVYANVIGLLNAKADVVTLTTANVKESASNLYYTVARANTAIDDRVTKTFIDNLGISSTNAQTSNVSQSANIANVVLSIDAFTTSNLREGANLYFTNARTIGAVTGQDLTLSNVTVYNLNSANTIVANSITANIWNNLYSANVIESDNALFYTNARVYSNVAPLLAYKANITDLTTANVIELTNLYYTNARVYSNVIGLLNEKANVVDLTTSNVVEGNNLYYTNARVLAGLVTANLVVNDATIRGNLYVEGDIVSLSTATLKVEDKNILLANGAVNAAAADGAGITIDGAQANLTYRYSADKFEFNKSLDVLGTISANGWAGIYASNIIGLTTANVAEVTNLYYTNARVYSNVIGLLDAKSNVADLTTANVTEVGNNIFYSNARVFANVSPLLTAKANVTDLTTANVAEVNNLYYTNARVNAIVQPSVAELRALVSRFNSNVLYVAQNGNDANDGTTMGNAFANIHVALAAAQSWTTVFLKSGDYRLYNQPVTIPRRVALVGDNLRTTTIRPSQPSVDMFYVNNACYVTGITFRDHVAPSAVFSYNPNGSAGTIVTSPYIQNSSSITTTGTGMRIDGRYVSGLRSMVCDAYTQTNEGGIGIHMLNRGYAQLVSVFTICCHIAIKCETGGFCSITNSNASFGTYGLWADGVSEPLYYGKVQTGTTEATNQITLSNLTIRPNYGDSVLFANYNQDKCFRDAGLIVDSLAIDLAYGSNTQATFAGLQYWAQTTSAIPNQSVETLAAINYAKSLATNIVANVRITSPYQVANTQQFATNPLEIADSASNVKIAAEFDLITSIISNGTVGVTDIIVPNGYPANTNAFVNHASNLLYRNNLFIASEVVTFVNTTYPGFTYNANTCFRDVGFILDSIRFDLLHGGNRQAVQAGTYYYQYDATDTQINDQVVQTGAAYYFIGNLVEKIVQGNVIANVYQTSITQNTAAAAYATSAEANILLTDARLIANIVTYGPNVAPTKKAILLTPSIDTNIINATKLVIANKDFIKAEVLEFVNQNWANISNGSATFYTVQSATELVANTSTITLLQLVTDNILANSRASFHQASYISSSGHTFEYVGSGDQIATALPYLGGVPKQENEVIELRGGQVYFTSTDQLGDFRIGKGLVINRVDGTITGRTFNKALFAVMTPYMLAIEG